ncbi:hypothetical protein J7337_013264 [Fusarium musae]|uniref:Uncharacterized protein n=1 Tax=Fusarium musae TaxID=1042133 RepID=A0A9P8D487_9HYPO|nr:hypothetical protein J7337_013264 [Fusarium musae]KAG9495033.1 hypothetical protein J7337_013264 [Fusarium musae]
MVTLKFVFFLLALGTESLSVICQSKLGTKSIPASKVPWATTTIHSKLTVLKKVVRKVKVVVVPRPTTTTSTEVKTITETTQADPDVETTIETKTAGFISAKGPDWRPKVKARDTPKDIAAPDLLPAGLQSETEYVQRIDCTKENPTTAIKVTTITVKEARVTANPKDQNEIRHINHNYNRDSVSPKGDGDFIRNYYFYCHGRPQRDRYCD